MSTPKSGHLSVKCGLRFQSRWALAALPQFSLVIPAQGSVSQQGWRGGIESVTFWFSLCTSLVQVVEKCAPDVHRDRMLPGELKPDWEHWWLTLVSGRWGCSHARGDHTAAQIRISPRYFWDCHELVQLHY